MVGTINVEKYSREVMGLDDDSFVISEANERNPVSVSEYINTRILDSWDMKRYTAITLEEFDRFLVDKELVTKFQSVNTFALIPMHAYGDFEAKNAYRTLEEYWSRQQIDKSHYGLIVFLNSVSIKDQGDSLQMQKLVNRNRCNVEIKRWMADNLNANVIIVNKVFEPDLKNEIRIGGLRKVITDLAIMISEYNKIERTALCSFDSDVLSVSAFLASEIQKSIIHDSQDLVKTNLNWHGISGPALDNDTVFLKLLVERVEIYESYRRNNWLGGWASEGGSGASSQEYIDCGGYKNVSIAEGAMYFPDSRHSNDIKILRKGFLTVDGRRSVASIDNLDEVWGEHWQGNGEKARLNCKVEKFRINYDKKEFLRNINEIAIKELIEELKTFSSNVMRAYFKKISNNEDINEFGDFELSCLIEFFIEDINTKVKAKLEKLGISVELKIYLYNEILFGRLRKLDVEDDGILLGLIETLSCFKKWKDWILKQGQNGIDFNEGQNKETMNNYLGLLIFEICRHICLDSQYVINYDSSRFQRIVNYQRRINNVK
jgi:hypothetical protein